MTKKYTKQLDQKIIELINRKKSGNLTAVEFCNEFFELVPNVKSYITIQKHIRRLNGTAVGFTPPGEQRRQKRVKGKADVPDIESVPDFIWWTYHYGYFGKDNVNIISMSTDQIKECFRKKSGEGLTDDECILLQEYAKKKLDN